MYQYLHIPKIFRHFMEVLAKCSIAHILQVTAGKVVTEVVYCEIK